MKNSTEIKYFIKDMPFQPKFKVGDKVKTPKDLYGCTEGEIYKVDRGYQQVDSSGKFDADGLLSLECEFDNMCVPWSFDGMTLKVEMPETNLGIFTQKAYTHISKFKGYYYSVKSNKMNTLYSEKSLRLKK